MLHFFNKKKLSKSKSQGSIPSDSTKLEDSNKKRPKLEMSKERSIFDFANAKSGQRVPFFVKNRILVKCKSGRKKSFVYDLNIWQRAFITMDRPHSCILGKIISAIVMATIVLSCVIFILSASPDLRHKPTHCQDPVCDNNPDLCPGTIICPPESPGWFKYIELSCIVVFTVEYVTRVCTVATVPLRVSNLLPLKWDKTHVASPNKPDPEYPTWRILYLHCTQIMNIVDLVAIVPFYIEYLDRSANSIEIIRILRLVRIIRVFKIGKYNEGVQLIVRTVRKSLPALSLLLFFSCLGVILFGCLIYFAESGTFTVNYDYPMGRYLRPDVLNLEKEISPFSSILVSMYWVVVCITTVGFGDMYPTTPGGRVIACIAMYSGVLVLALPISVMGSTFTRQYEKKHLAEDSDSDDYYESDEDDDFIDDEDQLEEWAIRNDGVLVRITPTPSPAGSDDEGAIGHAVVKRRDSVMSAEGIGARGRRSSSSGKSPTNDKPPGPMKITRRQSSADSTNRGHSYQSISGLELMLLQQQIALTHQPSTHQPKHFSFPRTNTSPLDGEVIATLLPDDGSGTVSAMFKLSDKYHDVSDNTLSEISGQQKSQATFHTTRQVRCGDKLSLAETKAIYQKLAALHAEAAAWTTLLSQAQGCVDLSSCAESEVADDEASIATGLSMDRDDSEGKYDIGTKIGRAVLGSMCDDVQLAINQPDED